MIAGVDLLLFIDEAKPLLNIQFEGGGVPLFYLYRYLNHEIDDRIPDDQRLGGVMEIALDRTLIYVHVVG